jgi:hypothetical protein
MDSIPEIRASQPHAIDKITLCDAQGMAEMLERYQAPVESYCSAAAYRVVHDGMRHGSPELSVLADKFLTKFEDEIFTSPANRVTDDVIGAVPNVGAYLAGNPMNMRRKVRTASETAPLAIFLELTGSAGVSSPQMVQRGSAMLALARLLTNTRPVELWTLTTYGAHGLLQMIACKIDTAPLDTARASFQLCGPYMNSVFHTVSNEESQHARNGRSQNNGWAYGVPDLERKWSGEILRRIIHPGMTLVHMPAVSAHDPSVNNPEQWVRDMLRQYSGRQEEAA